jgi:peptide/nickel transport system substrate-binding protein
VRIILASVILLSCLGIVFAEKGTFVDTIQFIQYLEESTALEEVKKGNLDMYYSRIPSELLQEKESTSNIKVFYVTGGSFSLLVNPAQSDKFNPFSIRDVRFALNYLVDRDLIVDELMNGNGVPMVSNYGPFDPDYLLIVSEIEKFGFRYNPEYANRLITNALEENGAKKVDGRWTFNGRPIEVTLFIRNDDSIRKSIGEILSTELQKAGFTVHKDFGDLNKAFVVVYGSDPAELKWSIYTEGYAGRSAFVKYDPLGLAQMYAPWFSNMPGLNNPTYWNYKNEYLDSITQKIYSANFTSSVERADLIRDASAEGVRESVRIFLAAKVDPFVVNKNVDGVINDFGGGITTRFTAINARTPGDVMKVGVKQIYQGAWNPVRGFSDAYSKNIWDTLYDPGIFKNPYSGENFPVRQSWHVETNGPSGSINVPSDAVNWNPVSQKWEMVGTNKKAVSKITYNLLLGSWHHGQMIDINDILYSVYFTQEWASNHNSATYDPEFSPQAAQGAKTLVAVKPVSDDIVEVYVDYWHFDESDIADWGSVWVTTPWEISYAMEQAVVDGKASFSRTNAQTKGLSWLSLIIPKDSMLIKQYLDEFKTQKMIPAALLQQNMPWEYYESRYAAASKWIAQKNHAVISNGPFYLESYSPEARIITIKAFDDPLYPFGSGHWSEFENLHLPKITQVTIPDNIVPGQREEIPISTTDASVLYYFVTNSYGEQVDSGVLDVRNGVASLALSEETTLSLAYGVVDFKLYAISDSVLRPDIYSTSSLVVEPQTILEESVFAADEVQRGSNVGVLAAVSGALIIASILYVRRRRKMRLAN